jgi:hypothetical protein
MGKTLKYVSEFTFPSAGKTAAPGYAKGGMAMGSMKSTKPAASPAPKSDMLYSKKENTAKTLLADGKGAPMPHAKGSVNMAKGGKVKMAVGGPAMSAGRAAMAQAAANRQAAPAMGGGAPAMANQQQLANMQRLAAMAQAPAMARSPAMAAGAPAPANQQQLANMQRLAMQARAQSPGMANPQTMGMGPAAPANQQQLAAHVRPPGMAKGGMSKVGKVMGEFKAGELHSGSKNGPMVTNRKQAVAIGMSEARKASKK